MYLALDTRFTFTNTNIDLCVYNEQKSVIKYEITYLLIHKMYALIYKNPYVFSEKTFKKSTDSHKSWR